MSRRSEPGTYPRTLALLLGQLLATAALFAPRDVPAATGRAFLVSVEGSQRSHDIMSVGDDQPVRRGDAGGEINLVLFAREHWGLRVGGALGGTRLNFSGSDLAGRVRRATWLLRMGLERLDRIGTNTAIVSGVALEYGEARSWLDNTVLSDEGPHNYLSGGAVHVGVVRRIAGPVGLMAGMGGGAFRAHANDVLPDIEYDWFGSSMTMSAGFVLGSGGGAETFP